MALGATAESHQFVMYVAIDPNNTASRPARLNRWTAVASAMMVATACCALLALVGVGDESAGWASLALSNSAVSGGDYGLAKSLIGASVLAKGSQLETIVDGWRRKQVVAEMGSEQHQMLALSSSNIHDMLQETAGSEDLCKKKDLIMAKFDALLSKLQTENVERNETDAAAEKAKEEAYTAWLDAESAYRLQSEKVKEANDGATYARSQYEKWSATATATADRLKDMQDKYPAEKAAILSEKGLIDEILRLLGVLNDEPAMKTGAAAKASPLTLKQVQSKIAELQSESERGGPIAPSTVSKLKSQLASFGESDEVRRLLEEMLKAITQRLKVLDDAIASTQAELASHQAELVKWEKDVVDLSNAADSAKQAADAQDLQRQQLSGSSTNAAENYQTEHSEFVIETPPATRAIVIIKTIKDKINTFCAAAAA